MVKIMNLKPAPDWYTKTALLLSCCVLFGVSAQQQSIKIYIYILLVRIFRIYGYMDILLLIYTRSFSFSVHFTYVLHHLTSHNLRK